MTVSELMNEKKITKYRLSKDSGIPYTTVNDICSGKAQLKKCFAETVYRISKTLGVTIQKAWYRESLYLLLQNTLFPAGVLAMSEVTNNQPVKRQINADRNCAGRRHRYFNKLRVS